MRNPYTLLIIPSREMTIFFHGTEIATVSLEGPVATARLKQAFKNVSNLHSFPENGGTRWPKITTLESILKEGSMI